MFKVQERRDEGEDDDVDGPGASVDDRGANDPPPALPAHAAASLPGWSVYVTAIARADQTSRLTP